MWEPLEKMNPNSLPFIMSTRPPSWPIANASSEYQLRCMSCHQPNDERETTTYCTQCGGVLRVEYSKPISGLTYPLRELPPDPLRTRETEFKYLPALSARYGMECFAKMELQNPTGCFKDRGSYVEVLKARELGASAIALASTGNMAASVAAYAAVFDIPCYVFVPETTSEGKLAQAMIYGAHILKIKGDYSTCESLCRKVAADNGFYLAGDYVFREEGQKSAAFEIVAQQPTAMDFVMVPVGCGTNFGALWKGLTEAKTSGLIAHLPRMVAIQPEHSSPVVEGIAKRKKIIKERVTTNAGAVAAANPVDFDKVLDGVDASNGLALWVTEAEILDSLREMAITEGIFTEPACALPLAAAKRHPEHFKGKKCLFILTGTGLKDTGVVTRHALASPVLDNDLTQVNAFIRSGYLNAQREGWGKSRETLTVQLNMDTEHQLMYEQYLSRIERKGKQLTAKELEVLQTLVFNEQIGLKYPIEVIDYDVRMKKGGLVNAEMTLRTDQGEIIQPEATGAGPVDAILKCAKLATDAIIPLDVVNHNVEVLSPDSNSLVVVSLTLKGPDQEFVVKAASPDTIEAALNAFIKGVAIAKK